MWVLWIKGHTTVACPHRVATEYGVVPAPHKSTRNALEYMFERQIRPRVPPVSLKSTICLCFVLAEILLVL